MNAQQKQTLGLLLLLGLFLVQLTYFSPKPTKKEEELSPSEATENTEPVEETPQIMARDYRQPTLAECFTIENDNAIFRFTTQGGTLVGVKLKAYKDQQGNPLTLLGEEHTQIHATFVTPDGKTIDTHDLTFTQREETTEEGTRLIFTAFLNGDETLWIKQAFWIPKGGYQIEYQMQKSALLETTVDTGLEKPKEEVTIPPRLIWAQQLLQQEKHLTQSLPRTFIKSYGGSSYFRSTLKDIKERGTDLKEVPATTPLPWVAFHVPYFAIGLIGKETPMNNAVLSIQRPETNKEENQAPNKAQPADGSSVSEGKTDEPQKRYEVLKEVRIEVDMPEKMTWYFGPNDYYFLKGVAPGFEKNHYLGPWIFRWFNTWIVLPVSEFLKGYVDNYIWILLLLILLLSLLLFWSAHKTYVNNIKIKAVKPIVDRINPTGSNDPNATMPTMRIYSRVGGGPIKGFFYQLMDIPIFIAMVAFTRYKIDFRQVPFGWLTDVSAFDDTLSWYMSWFFWGGPGIYHITLLGLVNIAVALLIGELKKPASTGQEGRSSYLRFFFPFILLYAFNNAPSSWWIYRLFSNLIQLCQYGLLKLTVDEKSIHEEAYQKGMEAYDNIASTQTQNRALKRMQKKK